MLGTDRYVGDSSQFCPYHKSSNHTLNDCPVFRRKSEDKRKEFIHTICFRCCKIPPHNFRKCSKEVKCAICHQSTSHCSALHPDELSSCNGKIQTSGRRAHNLIIESFDSSVALDLPVVTECDVIPDNRNEIPTPDITRHYPRLHNSESMIPPLGDDGQIGLLVGRDLLKADHVLNQRIGSDSAPYAQKLPLGWTIVGESCLRRCHPSINAFKTIILKCGRPSFLESCPNDIEIKEKMVPFAGSQRTT